MTHTAPITNPPQLERLNTDRTPKPGTYRAILADPPWSLHQKGKLGASEHYTLLEDDLILGMGDAIQEIAAEQSFCFLWVTAATLPLGIQVLTRWGYRYSNYYFWAKPRFTLGNTFRNAGELLLLGMKGTGTKFAFRSQPNWGIYPLQDHSHKPEEIHSMIERVVGEGPLLELFARREAPTRGDWDIWGNEIDAAEPSLISLKKWGYPVPGDPTEEAVSESTSCEV
ncbi:N6-adenosine-specific RNA methylase IME4 [Mycetocola sp. BIGb0189]|uniref:S-adenosylmethionine-binding domain-containing protein n=1 Tax=Mycetocola sp. BIGb0189 TaxID=2940604 RepID=UPI00216A921A|nr:S-adenosylmethionine-binding domain-containing protein [Mycetocola sp. BIGb0189]MCS4275137.1 N6-adenosine-specific RNA methylase IME4 [Mycetocola sp. BIGb0189]